MDVMRISLSAEGGDFPNVQEVSEFVYDVNLLFELLVLDTLEPGFLDRRHSWRVLSRTGRPGVPDEAKLRTQRVHLGSPLELALVVPLIPVAVIAVDRLVQISERIYNIPAHRRDLLASTRLKDAQAAAQQADARLKSAQAAEIEGRLARGLTTESSSYGGQVDALRSVERRLRKSLHIVALEIDLDEVPAHELRRD